MKRLLYRGPEHRLHKDTSNQLIQQVVGLVNSGDIELSPPYQRGLVWTPGQRELLIDSLLHGISMPAIILRDLGHGTPWMEVVDGKQRLDTLRGFLGGEYLYDGKRYGELPPTWQAAFRHTTIPVITVARLSDADTVELYDRINFCGTPHNCPTCAIANDNRNFQKEEPAP